MSATSLSSASSLDSCNKSKILYPLVGIVLIGGLVTYFYSRGKSNKNNKTDKNDKIDNNNITGLGSENNTERSKYLDTGMDKSSNGIEKI